MVDDVKEGTKVHVFAESWPKSLLTRRNVGDVVSSQSAQDVIQAYINYRALFFDDPENFAQMNPLIDISALFYWDIYMPANDKFRVFQREFASYLRSNTSLNEDEIYFLTDDFNSFISLDTLCLDYVTYFPLFGREENSAENDRIMTCLEKFNYRLAKAEPDRPTIFLNDIILLLYVVQQSHRRLIEKRDEFEGCYEHFIDDYARNCENLDNNAYIIENNDATDEFIERYNRNNKRVANVVREAIFEFLSSLGYNNNWIQQLACTESLLAFRDALMGIHDTDIVYGNDEELQKKKMIADSAANFIARYDYVFRLFEQRHTTLEGCLNRCLEENHEPYLEIRREEDGSSRNNPMNVSYVLDPSFSDMCGKIEFCKQKIINQKNGNESGDNPCNKNPEYVWVLYDINVSFDGIDWQKSYNDLLDAFAEKARKDSVRYIAVDEQLLNVMYGDKNVSSTTKHFLESLLSDVRCKGKDNRIQVYNRRILSLLNDIPVSEEVSLRQMRTAETYGCKNYDALRDQITPITKLDERAVELVTILRVI